MAGPFASVEELMALPVPVRIDDATAHRAIDLAAEADPEYAALIKEYRGQLVEALQGTLTEEDEKKVEEELARQHPNVVVSPSAPMSALAADASECTAQYVAVGVDAINIILALLGVGGAKGAIKSVVLKNLKAIKKLEPLFKALASAKSLWEKASTAAKIVVGIIGAVGYAGIKEAIGHMSVWEWIKFAATLASWVASGGAAIAVEIFNLGAALYDLVDDTIKLSKMGCA